MPSSSEKSDLLPEFARTGKLVIKTDPKPEIRKNAENATDWEYREIYIKAIRMAGVFKDRILDPIALLDRNIRLPDPVISFDDLRNNKTLAAYTLNRNPQGLLDEITFNTVHITTNVQGEKEWKYGWWAFFETLFHEQIHLLQENFYNKYTRSRPAHDKWFVERAASWGLHVMPVIGCHIQPADIDKAFGIIMKEYGYTRPNDVPRAEGEKPKYDWFRPKPEKGKSTLNKYECPVCHLAVRIGKKEDPQLIHDPCSEKLGKKIYLIRADGKAHEMNPKADYKMPS